jgi:hypothetical protein
MVLKKEILTSPDSPIVAAHELPLPRETRKKSVSCQRETKSDSQGKGSLDWNKAPCGPGGGENLGYQKLCFRSICHFVTEGHKPKPKNVYLEISGTIGCRRQRFHRIPMSDEI